MRPLDLRNHEHETFKFIEPTSRRLNKSVAWLAECKHCGKQQLVGANQVIRGAHSRCIHCQVPEREFAPRIPTVTE